MSQAGENNNRTRKPDHGETYLPESAGLNAPPPDQAPQALDHFKRGYNERAQNREREMTGFSHSDRHVAEDGGGPQKWQPPVGIKPDAGGGGRSTNQYQPRQHQQQRNFNDYNNDYNKYDDKQYTRSCTYLPLNKTCTLSLLPFIQNTHQLTLPGQIPPPLCSLNTTFPNIQP